MTQYKVRSKTEFRPDSKNSVGAGILWLLVIKHIALVPGMGQKDPGCCIFYCKAQWTGKESDQELAQTLDWYSQ